MSSEGSPQVVAIVGRVNVGKSTLVNRLASARKSIVGPDEGLTRDVIDQTVEWQGRSFIAKDTGGITDDASGLQSRIGEQALDVARRAQLAVLVIDVEVGVTNEDVEIARLLKRLGKPALLVANKVDGPGYEAASSELWSLGLGEPIQVSALHGRGADDLLDKILEVLPEGNVPPAEEVPSIAIVGRPNVGKSSLLNAIAGWERALVHEEAGTTRDSVDVVVELSDASFRFIDTAGLRRRARTSGIDVVGAERAFQAISRADLAVLVIDASEGFVSQDQRIGREVADAGVASIIALNKWDLVEGEEEASSLKDGAAEELVFLKYAPVIRTSATTKRGIQKLLAALGPVLDARRSQLRTSVFNRILQDAQNKNPAPRDGARSVTIKYGTQVGEAPPTFALFSNGPIPDDWLRFLENRVRESNKFEGNPIRFVVRESTRGKAKHKG